MSNYSKEEAKTIFEAMEKAAEENMAEYDFITNKSAFTLGWIGAELKHLLMKTEKGKFSNLDNLLSE